MNKIKLLTAAALFAVAGTTVSFADNSLLGKVSADGKTITTFACQKSMEGCARGFFLRPNTLSGYFRSSTIAQNIININGISGVDPEFVVEFTSPGRIVFVHLICPGGCEQQY